MPSLCYTAPINSTSYHHILCIVLPILLKIFLVYTIFSNMFKLARALEVRILQNFFFGWCVYLHIEAIELRAWNRVQRALKQKFRTHCFPFDNSLSAMAHNHNQVWVTQPKICTNPSLQEGSAAHRKVQTKYFTNILEKESNKTWGKLSPSEFQIPRETSGSRFYRLVLLIPTDRKFVAQTCFTNTVFSPYGKSEQRKKKKKVRNQQKRETSN